jgi:hypothetical protein
MEDGKKKRVLCPVQTADGKTFWHRVGAAFVNKDQSINLYLDVLPLNGKLQVRDWDDPPWEKDKPRLRAMGGGAPQGDPANQNELPF